MENYYYLNFSVMIYQFLPIHLLTLCVSIQPPGVFILSHSYYKIKLEACFAYK